MTNNFIHLNLHSQYSIVDSTIRIPKLMEECASNNMPAISLTDQNNVFGMVKFYRKALEFGVKPIIGSDIFLADEDDESRYDRITLLCIDNDGYKNLTQLITRAWLDGQTRFGPRLHKSWLSKKNCKGLIALSAGLNGDIGRSLVNEHHDLASRQLDSWLSLFEDRFYLELIRTDRQFEENYIQQALLLAHDNSVPVVATNDVRFLNLNDYSSHEARVCINDGLILSDVNRPKLYSDQQYLKNAKEMHDLFSDIPESLQNTIEIAKRCNLHLRLGESFLPIFPVPEDQTTDSYLLKESEKGLTTKLKDFQNDNKIDSSIYKSRLSEELSVINSMGFSSYFLIVSDFIDWAKNNKIPVGPGRGSGAGSLVAFVLGITNVDPLEHDLLFERFLNPERVSMPDFDIDFCMDGRDRVIDYVSEKYGRERVSQIITYGTMAARAVIRDVGRVLDQPYGFVDRIAKQVPFEVGMTLNKALEQDDELRRMYSEDEEVEAIINLAKSLEGLVRNAGKHAGGVVIAPDKLTDFTPLYCEEGKINVVTQFDKDDVESAGLVKFDFLGLRTLTIIDLTIRIAEESNVNKIDIDKIPMKDSKTFELLRTCNTTAIFQLESTGMRDLIKRMRPDQFDDLVALVALFRPGPLQSGMVDSFINRKHDLDKVNIDYLHPDIEGILKPTYGVILYQEQVMQIAQVLAGYSLGSADLLRRAMGKKKAEEMAIQRESFLKGSIERGVSQHVAERIFDLMEKFAGYGFNKSHSAAYALISYQTAYLKTHYTAAFLAAVMTTEMDNTDRLIMIKDDCLNYDIELLPPSINHSLHEFTVLNKQQILYGLGAIKGVGKSTVESIIKERDDRGIFENLDEFCKRLGAEKISRRVLESLIKCGALDEFNVSRNGLDFQLLGAIKSADQQARNSAAGQNDMFGLAPVIQVSNNDEDNDILEWKEEKLLKKEKEALGLYLSGHPFHAVRNDALCFTGGTLKSLQSIDRPEKMTGDKKYRQPRKIIIIAGLIADIRKRGNRISIIIDDDTARMEATIFNDKFQKFRDLVKKDTIIVVEGNLRFDEFSSSWQVNIEKITNIHTMIENLAKNLIIDLPSSPKDHSILNQLKSLLKSGKTGNCEISIKFNNDTASGRLDLGKKWLVAPTKDLRDELIVLLGKNSVKLSY